MIAQFETVGRVPSAIQERAASLLPSAKPRKLKYIGGEVIEVGLRYRLYRRIGCTYFLLMSHERYNNLTSMNRRRG